ncbi:TolC family protein, partial [Salmonella enterica]|uniref:TolC family protein n=1 Tax=Salmonella enterica TaxID=28901 RepID=UPI003D2B4E95
MMGNGVVGWVSASLPVFDRNRDTEAAKAQAVFTKARQTLKVVELDIARQIAQAWNELDFARQNAQLAEASVA